MEDKTGLKIKEPELQEEIQNALLYAAECGVFSRHKLKSAMGAALK
jgi:hypothetical protein